MDTTGDHGQTSTSLAQSTPTTNESNSAVSWASAFQSPYFMLGYQTAVSQAIRQYNAPTDRITQLESLGNPTQTATTSQAQTEGQVGDSSLQHNPADAVNMGSSHSSIEDMLRVIYCDNTIRMDECLKKGDKVEFQDGYGFVASDQDMFGNEWKCHPCEHEAMWAKTGKMQSLQANVGVKNPANVIMEAWKLKKDIDQFGWLENAGAYRFTNDQSWSGDHERFPGCDDNYHDRPPMPTASNNYNLGRSATSSQPEGSPAQMYNRLINGGR